MKYISGTSLFHQDKYYVVTVNSLVYATCANLAFCETKAGERNLSLLSKKVNTASQKKLETWHYVFQFISCRQLVREKYFFINSWLTIIDAASFIFLILFITQSWKDISPLSFNQATNNVKSNSFNSIAFLYFFDLFFLCFLILESVMMASLQQKQPPDEWWSQADFFTRLFFIQHR